MPFKFVFLWTDVAIWMLLLGLASYLRYVRRDTNLRSNWRRVLRDPAAISALVILSVFLVIGVLDSVHFRQVLPRAAASASSAVPDPAAAKVAYSPKTQSVFDLVMARQAESKEQTYSAPLAWRAFEKQTLLRDGRSVRDFPRLKFAGVHLKDPEHDWVGDLVLRSCAGLVLGALAAMAIALITAALLAKSMAAGTETGESTGMLGNLDHAWRALATGSTELPLRTMLATASIICLLAGPAIVLAAAYHVFGTDQTGNDVLYLTLKSVRTALVFGSLATIATLPLGIVLGILAGYFKGWADDLIQYLYTVLNSIPGVLLIAAFVLMLQVYIDSNPQRFETGAERADLRIFFLCAILGVTSWTGLCRLLRGETLKLRELEYVQAARAFGVSHLRIMARHIFPNLVHLVLITTVLEFSGIVLYEAVLSYVGIGVDPTTPSFGSMINMARLELSRDPMIWWSLAAAFVFMVAIVLSANLLADSVREAFDPRARSFRPRLDRLGKTAAVKAGARPSA